MFMLSYRMVVCRLIVDQICVYVVVVMVLLSCLKKCLPVEHSIS